MHEPGIAGGAQTLHQTMNNVVKSLDEFDLRPQGELNREPLSELEAFARLDPLLAHLNKQYLNAKAEHAELRRLNGADDPMAEIAADMEDSSWCAMQTRYLELRRDGEKMREAQRLMREEAEQVEEEKELEKEKKKALDYNRLLELYQIKENQKTPEIIEWYLAVTWLNDMQREIRRKTMPQVVHVA